MHQALGDGNLPHPRPEGRLTPERAEALKDAHHRFLEKVLRQRPTAGQAPHQPKRSWRHGSIDRRLSAFATASRAGEHIPGYVDFGEAGHAA